jgi:hypothetical protein
MSSSRRTLSFEASAELIRFVDLYAALHQQSRETYITNAVLDAIEGEGHAKMDLRSIPELQARGGPKMRGAAFVRTCSSAIEPPGKLYNSKGLAARLGVSRHMIYTIKVANRVAVERGEEKPLFHGRLSTVERIAEWMDTHRDWTTKYQVRKPEPPPDDGCELIDVPRYERPNPADSMRRHANQLRRFLARTPAQDDEKNLHGSGRVARACGVDEKLLRSIQVAAHGTADNPYSRTAWTTVARIRRWLEAHPEFVATKMPATATEAEKE